MLLPSINNPTALIEKYLTTLYYGPESFRLKFTQPAVLFPLVTLILSIIYFFFNTRLSRTHNLHLTPLEFLAEAIIYLTPGLVLCLADDLLNPVLFPHPEGLRAATQQQKRILAGRILARLRPHLFPFASSSLAGIAHFAESSFSEISSSVPTFDLLSTMARGKKLPVRLYNNTAVHCYQNSVLQALSTVKPLRQFLSETLRGAHGDVNMVKKTAVLSDMLNKLGGSEGMGAIYPTPDGLKLFNSAAQQDAQEYLGLLVDILEKEAIAANNNDSRRSSRHSSLDISQDSRDGASSPGAGSIDSGYVSSSASAVSHPFKGLYGMRTSCTACGYMEYLRIEPFSCITLHLSPQNRGKIDLASELDKYFSMEEIDGVHCNKCTLLGWLKQLESKRANFEDIKNEALTRLYTNKIKHVRAAVENEAFDDQTIEGLKLPKNARVATTKTKQSSIARPPRHIVLHIGRNGVDQYGRGRKIMTSIRYPNELDLAPWILGSAEGSPAFIYGDLNKPEESFGTRELVEEWNMGPTMSMVAGSGSGSHSMMRGPRYRLSAVVQHHGKESYKGHYTCLRKEPTIDKKQWWDINDHTASHCRKGELLEAGGAYMLFYECADPMIRHSSAPSRSRASSRSFDSSSKAASSPPSTPSRQRKRRRQAEEPEEEEEERERRGAKRPHVPEEMRRRPGKRTKVVSYDDLSLLRLPPNWCAPMSLPDPVERQRRHSSPI